MKWWKSGANWLWATWVEDAQVVYLVRRSTPDWGIWTVEKKVSGAADRTGYSIGTAKDLDKAKALAEADAGQPL